MNRAVLIIDVQQLLCTGQYAVFEASRVIERINLVAARARAAGQTVVLIQHEEAEGPMQYGAPGWQLAAGLVQGEDDVLLRKTASDAFHRTALHALLQARQVEQLVICGMQSDFCVDSSTRCALALGYPVSLVADGHSTLDNGILSAPQIIAHHSLTLRELASYGPRVELLAAQDIHFDAR